MRIWTRLRPLVVAWALLSVSLGAVQTPPSSPVGAGAPAVMGWSEEFIKWAFQQGGITIVLIVSLWSYRRDWLQTFQRKEDTAASERDEREKLVQLVERSITFQEQATAAAHATQQVLERLVVAVDTQSRWLDRHNRS